MRLMADPQLTCPKTPQAMPAKILPKTLADIQVKTQAKTRAKIQP